jgi:hypothetical protein
VTLAELIAALRRGDASPDAQRRAADLLTRLQPPKRSRGRPPKPYDAKLAKAITLIETVGAKTVELGGRAKAFQAIATATGTMASSVRRDYYGAKRLELEDWISSVFETEDDQKSSE